MKIKDQLLQLNGFFSRIVCMTSASVEWVDNEGLQDFVDERTAQQLGELFGVVPPNDAWSRKDLVQWVAALNKPGYVAVLTLYTGELIEEKCFYDDLFGRVIAKALDWATDYREKQMDGEKREVLTEVTLRQKRG